mgnify:CR=1 FL=1
MTATQPLNDENYASIEGLDDVFADGECEDKTVQQESSLDFGTSAHGDESSSKLNFDDIDELLKDITDEPFGNSAVEKEIPGTSLANSQKVIEKKLVSSIVDGDDRVSRGDLISLLEGFLGVLKGEGDSGTALAKSAPEELRFTDVDVEDRTQELEEMRQLVVEAQDTIIKLLTDRVDDRARIATLETELKLLPDLQEQADRAMAVAFKTEEFRTELHRVKFELEQNRIANIRRNMYSGPRGLLTRVQRWFLKARGRSMLQFNDAIKEAPKQER